MHKLITFAGAFAACVAFGPAASAQDADTVVATIDGTEITLGEMIIVRAQLPQQYAQLPDDVLFQGILDQLVQQQLLADSVGEELPRVEYAVSNEKRSLMAGEAINTIAEETITEDAIAEAFAKMTEGSAPEVEWNASHLLVETEEEAAAARERVVNGEEFADVARDVSTGPTGPSGGLLGWFSSGMMVPEFEAAVSEMDAGDVSEPVQTQFGWHIVTLNEKRNKPLPELEAVRSEIVQELQETAISARLEELKADADISLPEEGAFDPAILLDLQLLEPK